MRAVGQLSRLFRRTREGLGAVERAAAGDLRVDHTVPPSDSDLVASRVRGPVERLSLTRSHHLAPLDHDAPLLFETSARFLDAHVPFPEGSR